MSYDHLSEDLITEIFSRLPPKSLLRFRSLSKSLYVRISSPEFIRLHIVRSPKKFMIIHETKLKKQAYPKSMYTIHSEGQLSSYAGITPVRYPFRRNLTPFVGSCNGIICIFEHSHKDIIYLWNPSIRRKVTIHDHPSSRNCLAHGFGFDPILEDYKIVRISEQDTYVYTLKTTTWRKIASPTTLPDYVKTSNCIFNGALHWVVVSYSKYKYDRYILRFDLSSEVFSTIELPEPSWKNKEVTIIKGCLAVISLNDYSNWWIWVRNTAAASWSVAFKLNAPEQRLTLGDLVFFCSYNSKETIVFNPETETLSRIGRLSDSSYTVAMTTCIESLGLLDMGIPCDQIAGRKRKKSS